MKSTRVYFGEEGQLLSLHYLHQEVPVELPKIGMSFKSQQDSAGTLALLAHEPLVDGSELAKYLCSERGHLTAATNKTRFDCKKTSLSVLGVLFIKGFEFFGVFVE